MTGATATSLASAARRMPVRSRLIAARRDPVVLVIAAATAVGLALRLWQLSRPGYLLGVTEYDDGPYFGSAVLLVHGALPYRNFILVQSAGDHAADGPARAGWAGRGHGRRDGRGPDPHRAGQCRGDRAGRTAGPAPRAVAALVACGVLAVYPDSVAAAHTVLVEPWLVLFCLAGAVAVLDRDRITASTRRLAWGGAAFGFAGAVECWAILPVLVLLGLCLSGPRPPGVRRARVFAGGGHRRVRGAGAAVRRPRARPLLRQSDRGPGGRGPG